MKNRTITILLSIALIISMIINIYQFQTTSKFKENLSELTNTNNKITDELENTTQKLNDLNIELEKANSEVTNLTAEKEHLAETLDDLESENGIVANSTHTDIELGDDEYKGDDEVDTINLTEEEQEEVNQAYEEMKKKHPEWFSDTSGNTNQGNYEHVGTPDSGEPIPEFDMSGDFSELGDNVTVY